MNAKRRKSIIEITQKIEMDANLLKDILSEEQDSFDNIPENLQNATVGLESEEAQECLEEAINLIEEAICVLEDIC